MGEMKLSEKIASVVGPEREAAIREYYDNAKVHHTILQRQHGGELRVSGDGLIFVRNEIVYVLKKGEDCPLCGGTFDEKESGVYCMVCTWSPIKPKNEDEGELNEHGHRADGTTDRQADDSMG